MSDTFCIKCLFVVKKAYNRQIKPQLSYPNDLMKSNEEKQMDGSDQVAVRQAKLDQMRENGFDPFRQNWDQTHTSLEAMLYLPKIRTRDLKYLFQEGLSLFG